jgi:2-isopropylmalate synthase
MSQVKIFDTTLRDGEQSPGITLLPKEKLEIALLLENLGVDIIEAGFPIASKGDSEAVSAIASSVEKSTVCALARAETEDIKAAFKAIKKAKYPRIHTFLSTSDIHLKHQMNVGRKEALLLTRKHVAYARELCDDVQFSPMDATRSDLGFVAEVCAVALAEGAKTINIPDTVGYTTPDEYSRFLLELQEKLPELSDATLSVHTHQDLGLAVANAYAGVLAGARQVECAVNGIGERAGNCSLEEIVMLLKTRGDKLTTGINTQNLLKTSRVVARHTGYPVPRNKAIVGANAFAHESGIHQDGVLKERSTYEIMNPEDIGLESNTLVLGKHSGRHALREEVKALGYQLDQEQLNRLFLRFKRVADQKKGVTRLDLEALLSESEGEGDSHLRLVFFETNTGSEARPKSEVLLRCGEKDYYGEGEGDGPIDSVFQAINRALRLEPTLRNFQIEALTEGRDALGQVSVLLSFEDKEAFARSVDTDIVHAAARAYTIAIDKLGVGNG